MPLGDFAFVSKPFTAEVLLSKIRPEKASAAGGGSMSEV
jgi:hypothetical protein